MQAVSIRLAVRQRVMCVPRLIEEHFDVVLAFRLTEGHGALPVVRHVAHGVVLPVVQPVLQGQRDALFQSALALDHGDVLLLAVRDVHDAVLHRGTAAAPDGGRAAADGGGGAGAGHALV